MTNSKGAPYTIEDRQLIAETAGLRVQILTLASGQEIPWHHHTVVTDTFICLNGQMVVKTRSSDADHQLRPGDKCSVAPTVVHRVAGKDGAGCRFLIVQGIGKYDFIAAEN